MGPTTIIILCAVARVSNRRFVKIRKKEEERSE